MEGKQSFNASVDKFITGCREAVVATKQTVTSLMSIKQLNCSLNYRRQVDVLVELASRRALSAESVSVMIFNAPSLESMADFMTAVNVSAYDLKKAGSDAFLQFMVTYDYASPYLTQDLELVALANIFRNNKFDLNLQECLCIVLKSER